MDRALIYFALVVAGLNLPVAHAYGASQSSATRVERTANYTGQSGWSNAGPSTAPTITAQGSDRYATQPTGNWQGNTTQSISDRAQNAVNSTANSLRDGFNAGTQGISQQTQNWTDAASRQLQSAGSSVRNTAEQTFGASNLSSPSSTFATPPAPASYPSRGSLAPPPAWPTNSPATTNGSSSPFDSQASRSSNDRSLLTNPSTSASGGWTSIGTNIAAPPLLIPQLPGSNVNFNKFGSTTTTNGPALGTDSYLAQQSNRTFVSDSPSPTTTTARSAPADDWTSSWNNPGPETTRTAAGRGASAPSFNNTGRDSDLVPLQRASTPQDTARYKNDERAADSWANDRFAQRQDSPTITSAPANAQPTSSKSSPSSFGNNNNAPLTQPSLGQPSLGQTSPQSMPANTSYAGATTNMAQQLPGHNPANPNQIPTATNTSQPWMPLIAAVLSLAGSLAGNLFLGWSYMDARQKYQSLVRRTADTFRRTKTVAA